MYHRCVPGSRRRQLVLIAVVWLALLAVGWVVRGTSNAPGSATAGRTIVDIPLTTRDGVARGRSQRIGYIEANATAEGTSVLLLHGSPGAGDNFSQLGPRLDGRRSISPDLPGFGASSLWLPDYGLLSHAHAMLELLDELDVERAHVVGWSNGGGVALQMAALEPGRVASITLLASIGAQETEGSGSYWFEHAKYAFGYVAMVGAAELVPGLNVTSASLRHAFMRNFWDSDQRPLRAIMQGLDVPTLIYHGQHDFLTPAWGAELHHDLMPNSRLVMTRHSHFLPFAQAEETAADLLAFFDAVEDGTFVPGIEDRSDRVERSRLGSAIDGTQRWVRSWHWTVQLAMVGVLTLACRSWAVTIAAVLVALMAVDFGVATCGLWLGSVLRPRGEGPVRIFVARLLELTVAWALMRLVVQFVWTPDHAVLTLACATAIGLAVWFLPRSTTPARRRRALGQLSIWWRHEFWPAWVFYLPLVPWLVLLSIRHRHPLVFTCANPAIEPGGGVVGESKKAIINGLGGELGGELDDELGEHDEADEARVILPAAILKPGGAGRASRAMALIASHPELGGFPVILKPDRGEKGYAVRLARTPDQLERYLGEVRLPVLIQRYHPGPSECGVLWVREINGTGTSGGLGRIFSITDKERPAVVGDGTRTFGDLILRHPRYRVQFDLFASRLGERVRETPAAGETVVLAEAGNHAQGAIFRDGEHLRTPEFEAMIDKLVAGFDGELDFVRFDIRYVDADSLGRGEGLGVVEMNGVLSESTNLYDPGRSLVWAYGVLYRQWRELYRLGAWRRARGGQPMGVMRLLALLLSHRRERRAAVVAD